MNSIELTFLDVVVLAVPVLLAFCFLLIKSYAGERGKNLATRQDIQMITRRMEETKADVAANSTAKAVQYQLKYAACLDALGHIDAFLSHVVNTDGEKPQLQHSSISAVRACHNNLILTCSPEVVREFSEILMRPPRVVGPLIARLNIFRSLVRRELAFDDNVELVFDGKSDWIAAIAFERTTLKQSSSATTHG